MKWLTAIVIIIIFNGCAVQKHSTAIKKSDETSPQINTTGLVKKHSLTSSFTSYKGLVMAGYQGWFNAEGDGAGRGWNHYEDFNTQRFSPGFTNIDTWPDVSEYEKTYKTSFKHADGSPAYVFSPWDYSSVDLHFKWMQQYGVDGVFMQRFAVGLKSKLKAVANDRVLDNAFKASEKYHRAIAVMYDLSGMSNSDALKIIDDWKHLIDSLKITNRGDKQTYLYHNGKPLVGLWGVGFDDARHDYRRSIIEKIMNFLQNDPVYGGCSILLGIPTFWRDFGRDMSGDKHFHEVFRKADIISPWFVGRYNEATYPTYQKRIRDDIAWCKENKIDYVPVVYPGMSVHNMHIKDMPGNREKSFGQQMPGYQIGSTSNFTFSRDQEIPDPRIVMDAIPRNSGDFFWQQIRGDFNVGAEMLYIAMFDEIDEGTAILKIEKKPPVGASSFVKLDDDIPSDYYLYLTGYAAKVLKGQVPMTTIKPPPPRN